MNLVTRFQEYSPIYLVSVTKRPPFSSISAEITVHRLRIAFEVLTKLHVRVTPFLGAKLTRNLQYHLSLYGLCLPARCIALSLNSMCQPPILDVNSDQQPGKGKP
jgi:hypothetical protein